MPGLLPAIKLAVDGDRRQGQLFDEAGELAAIERSAEEKRQELARRRQHYEELREQLQRERARVQVNSCPNASRWPVPRRCFQWRWRCGWRSEVGATLA